MFRTKESQLFCFKENQSRFQRHLGQIDLPSKLTTSIVTMIAVSMFWYFEQSFSRVLEIWILAIVCKIFGKVILLNDVTSKLELRSKITLKLFNSKEHVVVISRFCKVVVGWIVFHTLAQSRRFHLILSQVTLPKKRHPTKESGANFRKTNVR